MKKKSLRLILTLSLSVFLLLLATLFIHIYLVTRPKAPDVHTRIMARMDIPEGFSDTDSGKISFWMYQQPGIDHVLCNPAAGIVVFTYSPLKINAYELVERFRSGFCKRSYRITASKQELQNGCPVSSGSSFFRVYNYFKKNI